MRFRHGAAMARALVQAGKAAGAGAAAMLVSDLLFGLPDAYVAAWSAILTVHVTVYRSARISVQQTAATAIGVVVAWSAVHTFGAGLASLTAAIFVALWIGSWHRFSQDPATAGSAGLFIFALGYASDEHRRPFVRDEPAKHLRRPRHEGIRSRPGKAYRCRSRVVRWP
jgi:hypothetical protein